MSQPRPIHLTENRKALLQALLAREGYKTATEPRTIRRRESSGPMPLSFTQQRLWFIDQYHPNSSLYNIPVLINATNIDIDLLERALRRIVERHEILRTKFEIIDGQPMQEVVPPMSLPVSVFDLRGMAESERSREAQRLIAEFTQRPFDLARPPQFRAGVLRLADGGSSVIISIHHIVADGWSTSLLVKELTAIYDSLATGRQHDLPELPIQYADFAAWQREQIGGERLKELLSWWTKSVGGAPAVIELPTDRQRPPVQSFRGASVKVEIGRAVTERLRALSAEESTTLFMTLQGALAVLLHRYSRQMDVVIGSPIANRTFPELESLIGPFINTLALRTNLSGDPTFRELLRRVRENTLGAYAHQDLPFDRLVEELHPERNPSYSPLFQVLLVLQNTPLSLDRTGQGSGPAWDSLDVQLATAKFDLTFALSENEEGLTGLLEYGTDLFDRSTANRMVEHFRTLLSSASSDPDRPIWALDLLPESERECAVTSWNENAAPYPERCLPAMFESQVKRTPDAVAVELGSGKLTYADLNVRANQLAHYLRRAGVMPQDRVGICVERSFNMIVAMIAVLKAGAVHTPLDAAYPAERIAYMLDDVGMKVVLTTRMMAERLPAGDYVRILLDRDGDRIAAEDCANPVNTTKLDDLAYVMFTSGSTGRPKGVAMAHRAMANLFSWQGPRFLRNAGVRTIQYTSFSFDVSVQEILSTLTSDGVLVLMPEELRTDFAGTIRYMVDKGIERLFLPFTALHHLAQAAERLDDIPVSLLDIISTGEQMNLGPSVIRFLERIAPCVLHNQYGPTETHFATAYPLRGDPRSLPALPLVGRPIANTRIYVLDDHRQPVPIGVPGEVYIGGVMVAREYFNHPERTEERFFADPFAQKLFPGESTARMYKTGDLARFHEDGNLEYLGRMDLQVKVRGFRIELGEIEATLKRHPSVRETVVLLRDDMGGGDRRLVAYVVPVAGTALAAREIKTWLNDKLPEYMIPSVVQIMEVLPMSPNGKIDRRALKAPTIERHEEYVEPTDELERKLAVIWATVLGVERVSRTDNFFELGGHSLLAAQIISRVRKEFNVEVPLRTLFRAPNFEAFAAAFVPAQDSIQPPIHITAEP
jgi:amino acid adenylation domain-containing protein